MLGRHHLVISLATVSPVILPFTDFNPALVFSVFFGTVIGSLIPDTDSRDATIFHEKVKGLNGDFGLFFNDFMAPVFPVFGYGTKYLIYKPAVMLYDHVIFRNSYSFQEKHRAFSHSFLGVITMALVTGIYISPLVVFLGLPVFYLTGFLGGYVSGAFLHLLEDSCTKTGIAWNSPFSDTKLKGGLTTSAKPEHTKNPRRFLYVLTAVTSGVVFLSFSGQYSFTAFEVAGIGTGAVSLAWLFFLKLVAKVELEE